MKQPILLLLLCGVLFVLAACEDNRPPAQNTQALSGEEQAEVKYEAYQRSTADFFGDFSSRYRQVHAMLQQDYDFSNFYYFSDDLQSLQSNLQRVLAMPGNHALDKLALNYLNAINALLPLDKKLTDYSNNKIWLNDGGAELGSLCRQLLPLLKQAAQAQHTFTVALQKIEDNSLWLTLNKYPEGSPQRYRLTALYYARRIYQGFEDGLKAYENQYVDDQYHLMIKGKLKNDIAAFDGNNNDYIASMPDKGSCTVFMNELVDFIRESRAVLSSFSQGSYSIKKVSGADVNTAFIRRNNDLLILKRHYLKVIASYNQGGC